MLPEARTPALAGRVGALPAAPAACRQSRLYPLLRSSTRAGFRGRCQPRLFGHKAQDLVEVMRRIVRSSSLVRRTRQHFVRPPGFFEREYAAHLRGQLSVIDQSRECAQPGRRDIYQEERARNPGGCGGGEITDTRMPPGFKTRNERSCVSPPTVSSTASTGGTASSNFVVS